MRQQTNIWGHIRIQSHAHQTKVMFNIEHSLANSEQQEAKQKKSSSYGKNSSSTVERTKQNKRERERALLVFEHIYEIAKQQPSNR